MAITPEGAAVTEREAVAGDLEELRGGKIEEDGVSGGEIGKGTNGAIAIDLAAGLAQAGEEGVSEGLGAAARERPADGMAEHPEGEGYRH